MKCSRYYLEGEKKGSIDVFVDGLPGYPDNLRYDGEGHYWLAIAWVIMFQMYLNIVSRV